MLSTLHVRLQAAVDDAGVPGGDKEEEDRIATLLRGTLAKAVAVQ